MTKPRAFRMHGTQLSRWAAQQPVRVLRRGGDHALRRLRPGQQRHFAPMPDRWRNYAARQRLTEPDVPPPEVGAGAGLLSDPRPLSPGVVAGGASLDGRAWAGMSFCSGGGRRSGMVGSAARWWHAEGEAGKVVCTLCPRECHIKDGGRGFCFVRANEGGRLASNQRERSPGRLPRCRVLRHLLIPNSGDEHIGVRRFPPSRLPRARAMMLAYASGP